jgi:hypothetical protein
VVKTRLMAQGKSGVVRYAGMLDALAKIPREEGVRALYTVGGTGEGGGEGVGRGWGGGERGGAGGGGTGPGRRIRIRICIPCGMSR